MTRLRNTVAAFAAMALTATLATTAMAADESEPEPVGVYEIEGLTWLLRSQDVDGQMTDVPGGVVVSVLMQDGQAGGSGGCNSYFTSYQLDGFDLSFGPIASTLMACPGPLGDIESAYFANLGKVASYQSGGIQMAFLDANGDAILEFDLAPEASVVGSWVAQGINNQAGGVVSQEITSLVTADFSADGDLGGSDGCNRYSTTYEVDGDSITIAPEIASTMMACPEDIMEQASWYIAALTNAATWSVDATGVLELRDTDGALQVRYDPAS